MGLTFNCKQTVNFFSDYKQFVEYTLQVVKALRPPLSKASADWANHEGPGNEAPWRRIAGYRILRHADGQGWEFHQALLNASAGLWTFRAVC